MNYLASGGATPELALLCQHGWAFAWSCWRGWESLRSPPATVAYGCRGYFQAAGREPFLGEGVRKVIVAHSLGAHLLAAELLAEADLLVLIGGFRHFHGDEARDGVLSRRHLQRMGRRLAEEPAALVADFYRDCQAPFLPPAAAEINVARLAADLRLLDGSELDLALLAALPRVLLLHGRQDRIVPWRRAAQLEERLPNATLALAEEGGHGLPFTAAAWCWARITAELRDL